jgi:hypothetical protein
MISFFWIRLQILGHIQVELIGTDISRDGGASRE